jgi:hypothetical protein
MMWNKKVMMTCEFHPTSASMTCDRPNVTVISNPTLYLGGSEFKSQSKDWLSWLRLFMNFLTPPRHMLGWYLNPSVPASVSGTDLCNTVYMGYLNLLRHWRVKLGPNSFLENPFWLNNYPLFEATQSQLLTAQLNKPQINKICYSNRQI